MMDISHDSSMEVPVSQPPQRVVSLVPSVTESLFDLSLGDRLVGITDYCVYPAQGVVGLPRVGGTKDADVERIIALRPDLVIANREENRRETVMQLQQAGIPVWVTFPQTVREAVNLLWNIMYVFDETSMVPRVRLIEQTLDWVEGISRAAEDHLVRVFVPIWLDPLMTFNANTYIHDLLRICGGQNVFAERERRYPLAADLDASLEPAETERDTRYPRISLDEVEAAQPEVILLPSEPFAFSDQHLPMFRALHVPAAQHDRIHLVDGSLLTWHGTRLAHALNTIPALLSREPS